MSAKNYIFILFIIIFKLNFDGNNLIKAENEELDTDSTTEIVGSTKEIETEKTTENEMETSTLEVEDTTLNEKVVKNKPGNNSIDPAQKEKDKKEKIAQLEEMLKMSNKFSENINKIKEARLKSTKAPDISPVVENKVAEATNKPEIKPVIDLVKYNPIGMFMNLKNKKGEEGNTEDTIIQGTIVKSRKKKNKKKRKKNNNDDMFNIFNF